MKYCAVYKTRKKAGLFLYVPVKGEFDKVPTPLMQQIGTPELAMMLPLVGDRKLANVDKQELIKQLTEKGFYLQMPPQQENWLTEHRELLGLDPIPDEAAKKRD